MKRYTVLFIVVLLALTLAGHAAAGADGPPAASTYTGTLTVIVGDPMPVEGEPMTPIPPIFTLHLADGRDLTLLPGAAGENALLRLAGQRVSVTLPAAEAEAALAADDVTPGVPVAAAALAPGAVMLSPEVSGNTKWLTIACKFADHAAYEPRSLTYFHEMYRNTYPGLDHYWREASYGQVNLTGSTAIGWYTLPKPVAAYLDANANPLLTQLANDCLDQADPDVYFPDYSGINLAFNYNLGCCAWGSWAFGITRDDAHQNYRITWLPYWAIIDLEVVQHEMGHGYRMMHSLVNGVRYQNVWDVMAISLCKPAPDPVYGCIGQQPIMHHRDQVGWLNAERVYTAGPGRHTIMLERATQPTNDGYLMVRIPINGSTTHYYTVEVRRLIGYDVDLPGEGVIIHEVDMTRYEPASLIMGGSREAYYGNQRWVPGEVFVTTVGNVIVRVDSETATGSLVTIVNEAESRQLLLTPTDDTYVLESVPSANYGGADTLTLQNPPRSQIYLKFDATSMPTTAYRVRLRLAVTDETPGARLGTLYKASPNFANGTTPWTEMGLNWANRPSETTSFVGLVYDPERNGSLVEWDITLAFKYHGVLDVLGIFPGKGDDSQVNYGSKEGNAAPQLVFDYFVVPGEETTTTIFTSTNDATVSQAKPKLISGTKPTLQVKDAAKDFNSYVKFNVSGLTGTVQSATLRLWVRDGGPDGGRVYSTSPFYPNTTTQWLETGLKWNNAPAITGTPLDAAGAVVAGHWIELNVTGAVTGNGRASFALTNDSSNLVVYSSKEGTHAPELVIVTD